MPSHRPATPDRADGRPVVVGYCDAGSSDPHAPIGRSRRALVDGLRTAGHRPGRAAPRSWHDDKFPRAMNEVRWVLTDRLDLRETNPAGDLEELFAIFSDPCGWWYNPAGRHTDREHTRDWLIRAADRFASDGL